MNPLKTNRRTFLGLMSAAGIVALNPAHLGAQPRMRSRTIPSTGEALPVIGLGTSKVVEQILADGPRTVERLLQTLVAHGGRVVQDLIPSPKDGIRPAVEAYAENEAIFGDVIDQPGLRENLFIMSKIDTDGSQAGVTQFREKQRQYHRRVLDLVQVINMRDIDSHWPTLQDLRAAGEARYIGATVYQSDRHERLEQFMRRENPDFVQLNYSLTERQAEERLLPLAEDLGIAVIVNRPFMNGSYFELLAGEPLPEWTADFDCETWAQFSLKYILANPAVTCVLTETGNPDHLSENAMAALGRLPDRRARQNMRALIDAL